MATLAEDELDIDAELAAVAVAEEKRKREEAAALLAQQVAQQEAQAPQPYLGRRSEEPMASSYIAPLVDDFGKVLRPGYDSAVDDARAMKYQALDEFNRRTAQGEDPAQVLAQVSGRLYGDNPKEMLRAVTVPSRRGGVPDAPGGAGMARVQNNYDPESGELVSRSIINPNGNAQSTQRVDKRLSQADKNRQSLLGMKIKAIQNSVLFDPANPGSELERLSKEYEAIGTSPEVPTAPRRQAPRMQTVTEEGPKGEVVIRQVPDPASTATYATPATPSASSESAETIRAQFRSGKLTQAEAVAKLKKLGFE